MKKVLAGILALTAVICSFTGCGRDVPDNAGSSSAVEKTTASEENTSDGQPQAEKVEYDSYEELLRDFFEAANARDYTKTLLMQYPEGILDFVRVAVRSTSTQREYGDITEADMIKLLQQYFYEDIADGTYTPGQIISAKPLSEKDAVSISELYGASLFAVNYIRENGGVDGTDADELEQAMARAIEDFNVGDTALAEVYYLTFGITDDSTGESHEANAVVYRFEGDSWRIIADPYRVERIKTERNAQARSIYMAVNSTLVDMDEMGGLPSAAEDFIISSDDSKNYNVPEGFDTELFKHRLSNYIEMPELEWFVIINGYAAIYAVSCPADDPSYTGIYAPLDENADGWDMDTKSYEELYAEALK